MVLHCAYGSMLSIALKVLHCTYGPMVFHCSNGLAYVVSKRGLNCLESKNEHKMGRLANEVVLIGDKTASF